jgi:hypothetical protein
VNLDFLQLRPRELESVAVLRAGPFTIERHVMPVSLGYWLAEDLRMRSFVLVVLLAGYLSAQSQESERQSIPALMSEVHQLRLAIERSTLLGTRMQISLQRIQMQELRTSRISQDHERLRKEAADMQMGYATAASRLKNDEEQLTQTTDPKERKNLEEVVKRTKLDLEAMAARQQQTQAREAELAVQVQSEQGRLAELNERVNQMERALDEALRQINGQR